MKRRPSNIATPGAEYQIRVLGERRMPLSDFYHALLRLPWWVTLAAIASIFLLSNALFAVCYLLTGGVAHAAPGSFADAYFFSVQTMGTIGYGALYPESRAANVVVVAETLTSLTLTALCTGLVFAKFSRSTARMIFSHEATIAPLNGVPTLSVRVGNQRGNRIVDTRVYLLYVRTETTLEGRTFYRMIDLEPSRQHMLSLSRSWNVLHRIDADSPLLGLTPEGMAQHEAELHVMVVGTDDTSMQPVHASHTYYARQILWGRRHADVLTETADGNLQLDLRAFHDTEPTAPTEAFPYPRS